RPVVAGAGRQLADRRGEAARARARGLCSTARDRRLSAVSMPGRPPVSFRPAPARGRRSPARHIRRPDWVYRSMDDRDGLAQRFREHRPRLRAVAYRMLGSTSEADDAVQEAWIRLSRSNSREIDNLEAWLVTVVGRVALSMLRSRRTRHEVPLEEHLPD